MHLMDIKQFFDIEILRAIMTCKREQEGLQVLVQTKSEDFKDPSKEIWAQTGNKQVVEQVT